LLSTTEGSDHSDQNHFGAKLNWPGCTFKEVRRESFLRVAMPWG